MRKITALLLVFALFICGMTLASCGENASAGEDTTVADTDAADTSDAADTDTASADTSGENPETEAPKQAFDENGVPMMIALTFDDGPGRNTCVNAVNMLAEKGAKATFFVVGNWMWGCEDVMKLLGESGNEIGSHSYTHPYLAELTDEEIALEYKRAQSNIEFLSGVTPKLFRPPYTACDERVMSIIETPLVYGLYGSEGDENVTEDELFEQYCGFVESGGNGVILGMHCLDGFDRSVRVAARLIDKYTKEGYIFVTVSEMFEKAGIEPTAHTSPYYTLYKTAEDRED